MAEYVLKEKSEAFALRIIRLYRCLQGSGENVLSKQLLRAGTSIGANIAEGHYASSKADFINKYSIAQKEAAETLYWITLLVKAEYLLDDEDTQRLTADSEEMLRLLAASIKTAKSNSQT